jgi:peptidoglycan hydrolase-like protein with peptidoglycan-binding domain
MRQHEYYDTSNLNAPYDLVPLQGVGQSADDPKYPWKQASQSTLVLQQDLNEWLTFRKGCLIKEDGILGPATCGAVKAYGQFSISTCDNHPNESTAPKIPCPASSSSSATVLPEQTIVGGSSGVPGWLIGVGLGAIAIGAALYLGKKKR